jgi:hypothetical protein
VLRSAVQCSAVPCCAVPCSADDFILCASVLLFAYWVYSTVLGYQHLHHLFVILFLFFSVAIMHIYMHITLLAAKKSVPSNLIGQENTFDRLMIRT